LPILINEWKLSKALQGLLGTVLFLGLFFGSLMAGFLIDKIGRKKTLEYVSLTQFILGIYSSTLSNVYTFLFVRGIFGFLLGFIIPLIPTLCTETIPAEKRGKITVLVNISFSVGQFLATIIAWLCLDNMTSGNWRLMLIICSIPPLLVYIGSRRFLRESPRYVILKGSVENGIAIMNEIVQINNDPEPLYKRIFTFDIYKAFKLDGNRYTSNNLYQTVKNNNFNNTLDHNKIININSNYLDLNQNQSQKNSDKIDKELYFNYEEDYILLKNWREKVLSHHQEVSNESSNTIENNTKILSYFKKNINMIKSLFNEKYKKFTIGLWITWFALNFTKYGLVFILPFFLNAWDQLNQQQNQKLDGIKSLVLTTLGEGFSGIFGYYLVDSPSFGRKYSIALGQLISSIFILVSYFIPLDHGNYFIFSLFIARLFIKIAFAILYPFTAEIYHTSLRTLGVGSSSAFGRIGSTLMPVISIKLFYMNMWYPFLLYFFVGMVGLMGTLILPYDTQGKHLDSYDPLILNNNKNLNTNDF